MTQRFGLKDTTITRIQTVLSHYPEVDQAILYGSRARGGYKAGSDIDLTLVGGEELTQRVLYRIMDEIDDLLLPYSFDLSIFHAIHDPAVSQEIEQQGVIFYQKTIGVPHT